MVVPATVQAADDGAQVGGRKWMRLGGSKDKGCLRWWCRGSRGEGLCLRWIPLLGT